MLKLISLRLARCAEFPQGSADHGYELIAPIDSNGVIDSHAWRAVRDRCIARRIWPGEAPRVGQLVHRSGGTDGATWIIDYDEMRTDDDEAGFRLGTHRFVEGEYVSFRDVDGKYRTYEVKRIADVGSP